MVSKVTNRTLMKTVAFFVLMYIIYSPARVGPSRYKVKDHFIGRRARDVGKVAINLEAAALSRALVMSGAPPLMVTAAGVGVRRAAEEQPLEMFEYKDNWMHLLKLPGKVSDFFAGN